jgi:multidrug resistance efflux pump
MKAILVGTVVLVALASALGFFWPFGRKPEFLVLPGVVEIQEVPLSARVDGRVAEVLVWEGEVVKPGQVLIRLEDPELGPQRDQVAGELHEAEEQLRKARNGPREEEKQAAKASLESAQATLKRLETGNRPEEIRQARSDLKAAESAAVLALREYERAEELIGRSAITRAEYDTTRASRESASDRAASIRARLELMEAGYRAEDIEQGRAEVRRAEANYRLLMSGTRPEEIAEAEARVARLAAKLKQYDVRLAELSVRAPEAAIVEIVYVRKGVDVKAGAPMVRTLRAADLWVKVYVAETDLGKVRRGQEVTVTVDSYPDKRFTGHITLIQNESEFTPRNIQSIDERHHQVFGVRVRVDDPQGVFKSGMAAEVTIPLK